MNHMLSVSNVLYPSSVFLRGHTWSGFARRYLRLDLAKKNVTLYEEDRTGNLIHEETLPFSAEDRKAFCKAVSRGKIRAFERLLPEEKNKKQTGSRAGWRMEYVLEYRDGTQKRGQLGTVYKDHPLEELILEIQKRIPASSAYIF